MRRREVLRALIATAAVPLLLSLGSGLVMAQEPTPTRDPSAAGPGGGSTDQDAPAGEAEPSASAASGLVPNNIVGLNVARLHQPLYIWATSDVVNANGGDWGYITVVWTVADREARNAEYDLQLFLDRCFEFHVQPIVRVATTFEARKEPPIPGQPVVRPNQQGAEGSWARPDWDEPARWRAYFEKGNWPAHHAWIIVGNEPNLGREWGGAVDAPGYARYLAHFLDVFDDAPRFDVVGGPLDISNASVLPVMQDALEFLDEMDAAVPGIFERLPAWASNPYRVVSGGTAARYTHRAYEAELDHIGRDMPVLITEAGHLETGDEQEIARFYDEAFRDWMTDPKVVAATPLFWHPDRNDFWMFELDKNGAFKYKSPTYELLRRLPRVAGSPQYEATLGNVPRTVRYEELPGTSAADLPLVVPPARVAAPTSQAEPRADSEAVDFDPAASTPGTRRAASHPPGTDIPPSSPAAASVPVRTARPPLLRIADTGGQGARLRAEPSPDAASLVVLPDGTVVEALDPGGSDEAQAWRHVRVADGQEGWVSPGLLVDVPAQ